VETRHTHMAYPLCIHFMDAVRQSAKEELDALFK